MKSNYILRILSIVISVVAVILLGWLWMNGYRDLSFIPLLLVAIALICSRFYQSRN